MTTTSRRGRPTREEAAAIEERLRAAAVEEFLAHGFEGTTMEAIAAAAGISKKTLYAKHADKRDLFATVLPWALSQMPLGDVTFDLPDDDLEGSLRIIGREALARLTDPRAVRLRRLALLEAHRFPELADDPSYHVWRQSLRTITELLTVHADRGAIDVDDATVAAHLFISMLAGAPTMIADLGVVQSAAEHDRHVDEAVALFLRGALPRDAAPTRRPVTRRPKAAAQKASRARR